MIISELLLLSTPIIALYLLLRDLVLFYFSSVIPGWSPDDFSHFYPRYSLQALAVNTDEVSESTMEKIRSYRTEPSFIQFVVPNRESIWENYEAIFRRTEGEIVPSSRKDVAQNRVSKAHFRAYLTAAGLAGVSDRTLAEEAASVEVAVIRHTLTLRRLILRYAKAFLILVVSSLVLIGIYSYVNYLAAGKAPLSESSAPFDSSVIGLVVGFAALAVLSPISATLPMLWIARSGDSRLRNQLKNDRELMQFERIVVTISLVVIGMQVYVLSRYRTEWAGHIFESENFPRNLAALLCIVGLATNLWFLRRCFLGTSNK